MPTNHDGISGLNYVLWLLVAGFAFGAAASFSQAGSSHIQPNQSCDPRTHHRVDFGVAVNDQPCMAIVPTSDAAQNAPRASTDCGDRFVIDILWCYTPAALAQLGDESTILGYCQNNIDDTNATFANSELPFSVRTVGLVLTEYDESGDHLALLQGRADGYMDEIHDIRDTLAADIVCLITVDGWCGVAYIAPNNEAYGFQKVTAGCLPVSAFRHELGHNLGSKHWATDPGGFLPYSAGHVVSIPGVGSSGTAMGGNSLQHYSNPRVNYLGVPTGIHVGQPEAADNWLAFMQTVPMVADFRCSGDCNGNGIDDLDEIAAGTADDCDANGIPDDCQVDLNNNGIIDACEALPVTIRIPEDLPSIQLAISLAESAVHEIVVGPGSWLGPIDTLGKAITIRSSDGPDSTTIYGSGSGPLCSIRNGEGPETVIEGFTFSGGNAAGNGGGMLIDRASPTVRDCVFIDNSAGYAGGAIRITDGSPSIIDCTFQGNTADWGGAVSIWSGTPAFERCVFDDNSASAGRGGGVSSWTSNPSFFDCVFRNNQSSGGSGGGLFIVDGGGTNVPVISGTLFCANIPDHLNQAQWQDQGGNTFSSDCPPCPADLNGDGLLDLGDIVAFVTAFGDMEKVADLAEPFGVWDMADLVAFVMIFSEGCP